MPSATPNHEFVTTSSQVTSSNPRSTKSTPFTWSASHEPHQRTAKAEACIQPRGESGSAGGFVINIEVYRLTKIFATGTNAAQAWGPPIIELGASDNQFAIYIAGDVHYSEDGAFAPAGQVSPGNTDGLLSPHLARSAIMAKIGKGKAFGLQAAYQEFPNNQHGWLHFSVNAEIARPGS